MNKTAIKNFAVWARVQLIDAAKQRAYEYDVTENGENKPGLAVAGGRPLSRSEAQQRDQLLAQIRQKGFAQVMEEAAYTWFNRFIALRYMEVNGYLPTRVFTDENGALKPELLKEAMRVELDGLDRERVLELLDKGDDEALYKYLFIAQCNALNKPLPDMFERISDWTELLFPANLLRSDSVIGRMISDIPEEDWTDQVQIVGWLYQYYNAELKDETFALLKKNVKITKERIPAATQLFTPDWVVRYMVENSLGRLWLEGHPDGGLKAGWKYYLDEAEQEPGVQAQLAEIRKGYAALSPEEIKFMDPCMGSGHILVYAFDVLMQIYVSQGWSERDAAQSIVEHNLFGLDIDGRAAQLAYFAVMMKARQYDRRFLTRGIQPQVFCTKGDAEGPEFGSLLVVKDPGPRPVQQDMFGGNEDSWKYRNLLAQKYHVVCTNPPYMGGAGMNGKLSEFVKTNYLDGKSDLFSCFMERCNRLLKTNGFSSLVTMQSWMFLFSFETMRKKLLANNTITTLMHMENMVMGIAFGTAVSVLRNLYIAGYKGTYNHIQMKDIQDEKPVEFPVRRNRFAQVSADNFSKIPGAPVAYWVTNTFLEMFNKPLLYEYSISDGQNVTSDNARFVRYFWEVKSIDIKKDAKWRLYAKGGGYRKWYGNLVDVVDWSPSAIQYYHQESSARVLPEYLWYRKGITWGLISSSLPSFRLLPEYATFDKGGSSIFLVDDSNYYYLIGLLNSKVFLSVVSVLNATLNFQVKDIRSMPVIFGQKSLIDDLVEKTTSVSCSDWDSYETSWDFKRSPLV